MTLAKATDTFTNRLDEIYCRDGSSKIGTMKFTSQSSLNDLEAMSSLLEKAKALGPIFPSAETAVIE